MFISKPTSTFRFGKLHFAGKLFTTVGATKKGDHSFCMTRQIGIFFTYIKFVKIFQTVFRIFHRIFHINMQFNEFHLAIIKAVFHFQIKGMTKQFQSNFLSSEISKSVCKLFT